jgi:hypothetical protein
MTFKDASGHVITPTAPNVTVSKPFVVAVNQAPGSAQFTIRGLQAGQTVTLSATVGTVVGNATINTVEGIWVADSGSRTIALYSAASVLTGGGMTVNVSPVGEVKGVNTGLLGPAAVQVGSDGSLYVLNSSNGEIYIYAPTDLATVGGASAANLTPRAVFNSTGEGLSSPRGIFINGSNGDLWETFKTDSTTSTPAIVLYNAARVTTAGGTLASPQDLAPFHTIAGTNVALTAPQGIYVSANGVSSGYIYVVDAAVPALDVYSIGLNGTNGNFAPSAVLTGANTLLATPIGVTQDSFGDTYVGNSTGDVSGSVIMFTGHQIGLVLAGGTGNIAPVKATTGISVPGFLWADPRGNLLVPNTSNNSFSAYNTPIAGGDSPTNINQGSQTFLSSPNSIATAP